MKSILGLLVLILSTSALAETKFSLGGGVNLNTVDTEGDLGDFEEEVSANLAVAGKAEVDLNEQWLFRTGLWLQEKSAELSYDKSGIDGSIKINTIYLSVPLNVQFKATPEIGIFGGYVADIRINDYCNADGDFDNCSLNNDTKSLVHNATLGGSFSVNEKLNIDVSWQQGLTDVYKDAYKLGTLQVMGFYKF